MPTQVIRALALLLFLAFTLAPAVKSWFTTLCDEPSIKAAVVTVGNPNDCSPWAAFVPVPEHERAAVIETLRNDRRDGGTGSEIPDPPDIELGEIVRFRPQPRVAYTGAKLGSATMTSWPNSAPRARRVRSAALLLHAPDGGELPARRASLGDERV